MAQESSQPWVGEHYHYDETRLLLLGKRRDPMPDHPTEMVKEVLDDFEGAMSFMKMLSRGLAGEEEPSKERLEYVWHRVAFTYYVSGTTGEAGERPTPDMWKAAKHAFPNILNKLRPRRIIVIGKKMWSKMPEEDVYMTDDVQGYFLDDHSVAVCWALPERLSWAQLAEIIHFMMGELPRGVKGRPGA